MAIQPIDLQIMYSQMSNVSKIVSHQQKSVQVAEAVQQSKLVQQTKEQVESVQKMASNESKILNIKSDGKQNQQKFGTKQNQKQDEEVVEKKDNGFKESYLGQHIDITR